jgi:hypothetical protein
MNQINEIVVGQSQLLFNQCKLSPVGLELTPSASFEDWEHIGSNLRGVNGAMNFWIGDWINQGEAKFGEKYAQAIEATEKDIGTLMNCSFVCKAIEISRRREKLSFSHHVEVAKLSPKDQNKWLQIAESENLSIRELRESIRSGKIVRIADIQSDSGKNSGLLIIQGVVARFQLWKRNVVDAGKIKWTRENAEMLDLEVIQPLRHMLADLEVKKKNALQTQ